MKSSNEKKLNSKRFDSLFSSLERKIEQLNKEKNSIKSKEKPNTIDVVCSQDDIERTAKRKK